MYIHILYIYICIYVLRAFVGGTYKNDREPSVGSPSHAAAAQRSGAVPGVDEHRLPPGLK